MLNYRIKTHALMLKKYNDHCSNWQECKQMAIETNTQMLSILSFLVKNQYTDVECTLETFVLRDVSKNECEYHDSVNKFWIGLKARLYAIPVSNVIENDSVCDVTKTMIT